MTENTAKQAEHETQPAAEATPETPENAEAEVQDTTAQERDEWKDKAMRLAAEMENLRKRTQKDLQDARDFAISSFARELLQVSDNMERALEAIETTEEEKALQTLKEGVAMVAHQLSQSFSKAGIEKIAAEGQPLDPDLHQAMTQVESDQPENTIVSVMQPGYTLSGRLLRPALVAVSKGQ